VRLQNKHAVVTGAAKGMGSAITLTLAREGADVFLTSRDTAALEEVAAAVRKLGRKAEVCACDVVEESSVASMVEKAKAFFSGRIDILINVAGVTGPIETPVQDLKAEDFSYVIESNIRGSFLPIKYVVPTMIKQRSGKIVNIGGTSGLRGYKNRAAYSSSKWAVRGLTRTVALEVGPHNINCNVVCPGIVHTPRMDKLCEEKARVRGWTFEKVYEEYVHEMALKRVTEPQDVANAVLFLASEDARNITGQELAVDGGWDV
jgi:NAD(P)-dependent dehydrogenase (short-subunit alcohol dehydrogenase family)